MPDRTLCGDVRRRVLWISVLCAMALAPNACAARGAWQPDEPLVVPYSLRKLGAGPQPVRGILVLEEGTEQDTVSDSLIEALQSFHLGVVTPRLSSAQHLLPGRRWTTDRVALPQTKIDEHNRAVPAMRLPSDRYYQIEYAGDYSIDRNELRFSIEALLHARGALEKFEPYKGDYSGPFFVGQLKQAICLALKQQPNCQASKESVTRQR